MLSPVAFLRTAIHPPTGEFSYWTNGGLEGVAIRGRSHLSLGTLVTGSTPLIWHMGKLRLGRLEGFAQSHTVSRWQSQDKNPGLWIFHLHQDIAPEGLLGLWGGTVPSPSPTPPGHAPSTQGARSLLRRVETQRPRAEPLLLLLPGPLPNSRGHRSLHGPFTAPYRVPSWLSLALWHLRQG